MRRVIKFTMAIMILLFLGANTMESKPQYNQNDSSDTKCLDLNKIDYYIPLRSNKFKNLLKNSRSAKSFFNFDKIRNLYIVDTIYIPEYQIIIYKEDYTFIVLNKNIDYKTFNFDNPLSNQGCFLADSGFFLDSYNEASVYNGALRFSTVPFWPISDDLKKIKKRLCTV